MFVGYAWHGNVTSKIYYTEFIKLFFSLYNPDDQNIYRPFHVFYVLSNELSWYNEIVHSLQKSYEYLLALATITFCTVVVLRADGFNSSNECQATKWRLT